MSFKPMLAKDYDPAKLVYPVYASPKLDGIRCSIVNGKPVSRTLKDIPSLLVRSCLTYDVYDGLDGELIVGDVTADNVFSNTTSHVMAHDKAFDFTYYVFDLHNTKQDSYARYKMLRDRLENLGEPPPTRMQIVCVTQTVIHDEDELAVYEAEQIAAGYEGVILRKIDGHYKYGRSTVNEGLLLKVKRFVDNDFEILGFEEQLKNNNEKTVNELGRSKRSSHQENKVGKGTLGALKVRDVETLVEFNIGTGMDDALRAEIWDNRDKYLGKFGKYKSFPIGVKSAPRHPVFMAFRHRDDML